MKIFSIFKQIFVDSIINPLKFNGVVGSPLYLRCNSKFHVGNNFSAGRLNRIELWDSYKGFKYSPNFFVGDNVSFNNNIHIGCINSIFIGDNCLLGSNILITDHDHCKLDTRIVQIYKDNPLFSKGPVHIGKNCWIGDNVSILPGVSLGNNCVVGSGTVVTKSFPKNSLIVGNPAKLMRVLHNEN